MNDLTPKDLTRQHHLTIEEIRSSPLFSHFSDEQAQEVIETFKKLAVIIVKYAEKNEENTCIKG